MRDLSYLTIEQMLARVELHAQHVMRNGRLYNSTRIKENESLPIPVVQYLHCPYLEREYDHGQEACVVEYMDARIARRSGAWGHGDHQLVRRKPRH